MIYLLDTSAFLKFLFNDKLDGQPITDRALSIIQNADMLYMSIISLWEIALKVKKKKLDIGGLSAAQLEQICKEQSIQLLPLDSRNIDHMSALPDVKDHKDPFDRIILATAQTYGMSVITSDTHLASYGVDIIW